MTGRSGAPWLAGAGVRQAGGAVLAQDAGGPAPGEPPRARVLLVEDDYFVALTSEDTLTDAGHEVVGVAATADQAVAIAGAERPELVVMDIRLRGARDGIDAAREIRERFGIPSIFVTAQADPGTRQRGDMLAHPLGWLLKPYAASELAGAVAAALTLARRQSSQN